MSKKCILILPYFGKFNSFFNMFLDSCAKNILIDWLIFSDNTIDCSHYQNIKAVKLKFEELKKMINSKFDFECCIPSPYKLCDFKPSYGFIFEEYIGEYEYWGHCDCDLIFGDLDNLLVPLLEKGYDKLFAAGHLTLYRNNIQNNRRFMEGGDDPLYKRVFTSPNICWFDEDHHSTMNVHKMFLRDGASVFAEDLSMNPYIYSAKFIRAYYSEQEGKFLVESYKRARYFVADGKVFRYQKDSTKVYKQEFLYIHLQARKMRMPSNYRDNSIIEILPDRFRILKTLPNMEKSLNGKLIGFPGMFWIDFYIKKIKRKLKINK